MEATTGPNPIATARYSTCSCNDNSTLVQQLGTEYVPIKITGQVYKQLHTTLVTKLMTVKCVKKLVGCYENVNSTNVQ